MKTLSKFHIGMIRASALGVLNAIAKEDYQAFVVKAAKLRFLAVKLSISLKDVLPASVIKVTYKVLDYLYNKIACPANYDIANAIDDLLCFLTDKTLTDSIIKRISSLLILPKLPALR